MKIFWIVKRLNLKTVFFNFKHFTIKEAIRFPVFIAPKTVVKIGKEGKFKIEANALYPGMIRIGFKKVGIFDRQTNSTVIEISGNIIFKGAAYLGLGSKISVLENATLELGKNFTITALSTVICGYHIKFGENCLLSWEITIMDTDFHSIFNEDNNIINRPKDIFIGNNVWIGCKTTILKGCTIGDNNVIAMNSLLTKEYNVNHSIIGGNPGRILKEKISWKI